MFKICSSLQIGGMHQTDDYFIEIVALGIHLTAKLIYNKLCGKFYSKKIDALDEKYLHHVIFFPDKGILQSHQTFANIKERERKLWSSAKRKSNSSVKSSIDRNSTSLIHILDIIRNARNNISICLLILSCPELEDEIIKAKKRRVKVRILVDKVMADVDGSSIPSLQRENIPILRGPPNMMLHHKFALVDVSEGSDFKVGDNINYIKTQNLKHNSDIYNKSGILITGSFNWTWSAVTSNFENVIITDDPRLVKPFAKEFEHLWTNFKTSIYLPNSDKMEIPKYVL